jgi:hypothetical protein
MADSPTVGQSRDRALTHIKETSNQTLPRQAKKMAN